MREGRVKVREAGKGQSEGGVRWGLRKGGKDQVELEEVFRIPWPEERDILTSHTNKCLKYNRYISWNVFRKLCLAF